MDHNDLSTRNKNIENGFSLIEIIIVVVIISILAGIVFPNYRHYTLKTNRSDAFVLLVLAAAEQERFYAVNHEFIDDVDDLGGSHSPENFYTLSVSVTGSSYLLTATANESTSQSEDTGCTILTLNHQGIKTPLDCWQ